MTYALSKSVGLCIFLIFTKSPSCQATTSNTSTSSSFCPNSQNSSAAAPVSLVPQNNAFFSQIDSSSLQNTPQKKNSTNTGKFRRRGAAKKSFLCLYVYIIVQTENNCLTEKQASPPINKVWLEVSLVDDKKCDNWRTIT